MAAVSIPQVVTEVSASGAQVIDGSLKFEGGYLKRTPSTAGNRKTWTYSCWVKFDLNSSQSEPLLCAGDSSSDFTQVYTYKTAEFDVALTAKTSSSDKVEIASANLLRDTGWYHIVAVFDSDAASYQTDTTIYVNGVEITRNTNTYAGGENYEGWVNSTSDPHYIGYLWNGNTLKGEMSQVYLIDGQALDASYFGYTDLLTNTWRPKKYTGDYNITAGGDEIVSGATLLTWDDSPIGSIYTLSNSDKTATAGGGSSGYANADVWSIAIPANTTYAWTLDITNGDSTGGWYFTDSQTASMTHADERGGNSCGLRGGETSMGTHGTFATANGTSSGQSQISVNSAVSPNGTKKIDFVVYRPSSGDGKVWIRGYGADSWLGGGDPTNTSSTATFAIPDGTTYFGMTAYDRSSDQVLTFDALGTVPTGVNSFYLPLDGRESIGRDQSPNANDWTPVNFGNSTTINKATEAFPILNTQSGGKVAAPCIRGQAGIAVTVYGMKYYLDGIETPSLDQYRGQTVTFDLTDSTCASHPLRLSTTSDGTHGGGSEYSEGKQEGGTPGSVGAATTITYPHNAPDTLYYYCGTHSGMGGTGSVGLSSDARKADPYAWRNVLAAPLTSKAKDVGIACTLTPKILTSHGDTTQSQTKSNLYESSNYFDGTGDYIVNASSSSDFSFGTGDFTIECWAYWTGSSEEGLFQLSTNSTGYNAANTNTVSLRVDSGVWKSYANDGNRTWSSKAVTNRWYHLAIVRDSGTLKLFVDGVQDATTFADTRDYSMTYCGISGNYSATYLWTGYIQDFKVYKGVAKYVNDFFPASTNPSILSDTPSGVAYGSELAKVPENLGGSVWFDGVSGYIDIAYSADFTMDGDFTIEYFINYQKSGVWIDFGASGNYENSYQFYYIGGSIAFYLGTGDATMCGGDGTMNMSPGKWTHHVIQRTGTTCQVFEDGVLKKETTLSGTAGNNTDNLFRLGAQMYSGPSTYFGGYLSNVRVIKGTALYPTVGFIPPTEPLTTTSQGATASEVKLLCCQSSTDETTAAVTPGTLTANGGTATSNFNPFTKDNIDLVMGQETGYCTLNPLGSAGTLSQGNLVQDGGAGTYYATSTMSFSSGKWYAEFALSDHSYPGIGVCYEANPNAGWMATQAPYYFIYDNGSVLNNYPGGAEHFSPLPTTLFLPGVFQVALDVDNGKCWIGYQNTWYSDQWATTGDPVTGANATFSSLPSGKDWFFFLYSNDATWMANFGQKPFTYPPPEGFQSPNYANLTSPGVVRPDSAVGVTTYVGNGSTQSLTGLGFQPDLVWIKVRTGAYNHVLYDSVRGPFETLEPSATGAQNDRDPYGVTSFDTDGFSVKGLTNGDYQVNGTPGGTYSGSTGGYVGWCWKAGGNKGTYNVDDVGYASAAAAGLTGAVNCTQEGASVGTKQGFSITVQEATSSSGATMQIPHGLTQKPDFIIGKDIDTGSTNWGVYHVSVGATKKMELDAAGAAAANANYWDETEPTSSVIYTNAASWMYPSSSFVMYSWHNVPGLQKFGSYEGNNATDGTFVELGFRPAIVIFKNMDASEDWMIVDDNRSRYNPVAPTLYPNGSDVESSATNRCDFLSNGFKLRSGTSIPNTANTYIYAAWAHQPMNGFYGAQSNAR